MTLPVFIGFDSRAPEAYRVARSSIMRNASGDVSVEPLVAADLRERRLLWRPLDQDGEGRIVDVLSNAHQSTEFASSRFLVPFLTRERWALFMDQDVIALGDVRELLSLADERYAVMVVQHQMPDTGALKMGGEVQTPYQRKNWSSVCLWNTLHPSNTRLTVAMVNQYPGDLLHRFFWLRDSEIGALPAEWNWLVNVQPKPPEPKLAHFTLGGPWIKGWQAQPYDGIWLDASRDPFAG